MKQSRFNTLLRKRLFNRIPVWTLIILLILIIGVRAVVLFTHTFPSTTKPTQLVSSLCSTISFPSPPIGLVQGTLRGKCDTNPAFTRTTTAGSVSPTFTLGTGYTALSFVIAGTGSCTAGASILTGAVLTLVELPAGDYDYCLSYNTSGPTLGEFTLTWNQ